jgi:hypothetical protein
MAANKIKYFLSTILFALSLALYAENNVSNNEVIDYLHKNIAQSTVELGASIQACEKQRMNSKAMLLDTSKLEELNANKKDILIALTHFNFRNSYMCEKSARLKLAYDLGKLASIKRKLNSNIKEVTSIEDNLIYPTVNQTKLSIKYLNLPILLKKYIHTSIGDKPFDLIKTLKINSLLNI